MFGRKQSPPPKHTKSTATKAEIRELNKLYGKRSATRRNTGARQR